MFQKTIIIAAIFLPGAAFAQCPTAADMAQGISLSYDTGEFESFQTGPDNTIIVEGFERNGDSGSDWTASLLGGLFELTFLEREIGYWQPTSDYRLEYDFNPGTALPLQSGFVGGGTQTLIEDHSSEAATYSFSVHSREDLVIDGCGYAALDIYQTYLLPDKKLGLTQVIYLTDLGFGFVANQKWPGSDAISSMPISISVSD